MKSLPDIVSAAADAYESCGCVPECDRCRAFREACCRDRKVQPMKSLPEIVEANCAPKPSRSPISPEAAIAYFEGFGDAAFSHGPSADWDAALGVLRQIALRPNYCKHGTDQDAADCGHCADELCRFCNKTHPTGEECHQ